MRNLKLGIYVREITVKTVRGKVRPTVEIVPYDNNKTYIFFNGQQEGTSILDSNIPVRYDILKDAREFWREEIG